MSEVRPINAYALIKIVNNEKAPDWWKEIISGWIEKQPTVDAVPVEWIESYARDARATGDFSDEMCAVAIEAMLNDYRADGEKI